MDKGWAWLQRGVLLMVLTTGFLLSRPARPHVCCPCDWAMKRVVVSTRAVAAGESLGEGMRVDELREQDVPKDAFVFDDDEGSPAYEYVLGIAIGPNEIIRGDSLMLKRASAFDGL